MGIKIDAILHVGVVTRDIDRMVAFYTDVFEAQPVKELSLTTPRFGQGVGVPGATARTVHLQIPGASTIVELTQYAEHQEIGGPRAPANTPGIRHFALSTSDIARACDELNARGYEVVGGPVEVDEPPSARGTRFLYFRDPEGNLIELIEPPSHVHAPAPGGP